jgi:4-hydroxyphenylacetate 3-monooxygenase
MRGLRDGRTVLLNGECVADVTTHPAFAAGIHTVAKLYDLAHDPTNRELMTYPSPRDGRPVNKAWLVPRTREDLAARRRAIKFWADASYGFLGRSPDHVASFFAGFAGSPAFYLRGGQQFADNLSRFAAKAADEDLYVSYVIVHPTIDRAKPAHQQAEPYLYAGVAAERGNGIVIRGAQMLGTGSVMSDYVLVTVILPLKPGDEDYAIACVVPNGASGLKLYPRRPYALGPTSVFDYPLSSRLDENDAVFIMDKVLVPWENVFVYGDLEKANNFFPRTGFLPRFVVHGCTRLAVKLDFIAGLLLKAVEASGTKDFRGVQANVGEVLAWRNLFWGLSDAMVRDPRPWIGDYILPNMDPGSAYHVIATIAYTKIKYLIEQTVASGLIYLNSHARDFDNEDIRPYLDRYLRGSNGYTAEDRVKLGKLLWDALGSEFGGRHELYEINYAGSTEEIRRYCLFGAQASGAADRFKGFAEQCMAEYDLHGWKSPDLMDPGALSYHAKK